MWGGMRREQRQSVVVEYVIDPQGPANIAQALELVLRAVAQRRTHQHRAGKTDQRSTDRRADGVQP